MFNLDLLRVECPVCLKRRPLRAMEESQFHCYNDYNSFQFCSDFCEEISTKEQRKKAEYFDKKYIKKGTDNMRTNHAGVTEVAHLRGNDEAYRENYERIFGRKGTPPKKEIDRDAKAEAVAQEVFEEKQKNIKAERLRVLNKILFVAASEYLNLEDIKILEGLKDEYELEVTGSISSNED